MSTFEKLSEENHDKTQVEKLSETDKEFFKTLGDISYRTDLNPGEYNFVGQSAQKDFDTLKNLESRINATSEENREKLSETIFYLKNKITDDFDVED